MDRQAMEEEIDLDAILTPEERKHYQRFLGQARIVTFVHPDRDEPWKWAATGVRLDDPGRHAEVLREVETRPTRDGLLIPHGFGPDTCSTSQVLALSPEWCWDVCNYYGRLGLHWKATRKQIREALLARKAIHGAGKSELIYAAKQLLDENIRREYDRVPLGMLFLKDKDVVALLKRAAQQAASAMAARGFRDVTPEDVLGEWGFNVGPPDGTGGEGEEGKAPAPAQPSPARSASWPAQWCWYSDPMGRISTLAWRMPELERWQQLLVSEFAKRGMVVRFAVGLCTAETFLIRPAPNPGIIVILLGEGEPTPELAVDAVDMWGLATETKRPGDRYAAFRQGRRQG